MPVPPRSLSVVLHAGKVDASCLRAGVEALRARGHTVTIHPSEQPGDTRRLAAEAARQGADVVVAGGGDGTLNEVVAGVCEAGTPARCAVAVLPLGTANDFAAACGIPHNDVPAALTIAAEATITRIDVGRINGHLFVNAASGGFGAEITAGTPETLKTVLGGFAYAVNGLVQAANVTRYEAHLTAPGFAWEGTLVAFSLGNGRLAGGGFSVAPTALLNDGLLDLVLVPDVSLGVLADVVSGTLGAPPEGPYEHLVTCQAPRLDLTVAEPMPVNLDGETMEGETFHVDVLNAHVPFCLPPTAPLLP